MVSIKRNFVYQLIWQLLSMALPLVTSPLLSRTLGADGLGVYGYTNAIVGYFVMAANLGVHKYGVREISGARGDRKRLNRVFWEIWWLHSLISLAVGSVYLIYAFWFSEYPLYFGIMSLSYLGHVLSLNWLFIGMEDFKKITVRDMVIKLVSFGLILLFIHEKEDLIKYILLMSLCSVVSGLVFWVPLRKYIDQMRVSLKGIFSHWKGFLILFVPVLLESVYVTLDKVMLGSLDTKTAVGYYENAEKALIANRIISALTIVMMPRMASLAVREDEGKINQLLKKTIDIAMLLSVAFAFGTAAIAKEFSVVFWGSDFSPCTNLIMIMALVMPVTALSQVIREGYLIPAKQDRKYMISAGAGAMTDFVLNLVLIPRVGVIGAAVSTFIADYTVLFTQAASVRKRISLRKYLKGNYIYLIFGSVMFAVARFVGNALGIHILTLLLEIILGAGVYILLCIVYWKITKQSYYFQIVREVSIKIRKGMNGSR